MRPRARDRSAVPGAPVPAGYLDTAAAAARLGLPATLVALRAVHQPHLLPAHVLVDGHPWFDPTALPGAGS